MVKCRGSCQSSSSFSSLSSSRLPQSPEWLSLPPLREVNHILVEHRFLSHVLHFLLLSSPLQVGNLLPCELASWKCEYCLEKQDVHWVLIEWGYLGVAERGQVGFCYGKFSPWLSLKIFCWKGIAFKSLPYEKLLCSAGCSPVTEKFPENLFASSVLFPGKKEEE